MNPNTEYRQKERMKFSPAQLLKKLLPDGKTKIPAHIVIDKMGSSIKVGFEVKVNAKEKPNNNNRN